VILVQLIGLHVKVVRAIAEAGLFAEAVDGGLGGSFGRIDADEFHLVTSGRILIRVMNKVYGVHPTSLAA